MVPTLRSASWDLTVLPRVGASGALGAEAHRLDPGFHTVRRGAYDGQFYWAIAIDPLATGRLHDDLDKPSYRYGHPLYAWLAWLVSVDRARAVPAALAALGLGALFCGAVAASLLGRRRCGWSGVAVAGNPGLLSAAAHDLAEPLGAALLLASFLAYRAGRVRATWLMLALLPLAKEPLLAALLVVVGFELHARRFGRAVLFATAAAPALAWWVYARSVLGAWFTSGDSALGSPFVGWWQALFGAIPAGESPARHLAAVLVLLVLLGLLALGAVRAWHHPTPIAVTYLALLAAAICLATNATLEFSTALRNTAFVAALLPFVLAGPLRSAVAAGGARRRRAVPLAP
jgi:hypothetical protein